MMREVVKVCIEMCHPEAKKPAYARPGDAGMDIYAVEEAVIAPGETMIVRTGLKLAIPEGYEVQIRPRSGLSLKTPLRVANSPGTIDAGYREEVGVIMHNTSVQVTCTVNKGDRIAQMILQRVPAIEWKEIDSVEGIGKNRGGGFGSSGR